MKKLLYHLRALVYPERCPYCGSLVEADEFACPGCLELIKEKHIPLIGGAGGFRCISSYLYGGHVRRAIINLKFYDRTQYIPQIAEIMAVDIRNVFGDDAFDIITAVPMHEKDLHKRGYNQSELLAKHLSKRLAIPYQPTLNKIKRTKKQHTLTYNQRKKNLNGAFAVIDKDRISGRRILLIDDIVTSGTTLGKCAKVLNHSKPAAVCCATIAAARNYYPDVTLI